MIADITVVPIGTGSPSVGIYVMAAFKVLKQSGLKFRVGPMSTSVEGDWESVMTTIRNMQEVCFHMGALRVLTTIRIDERRDRVQTMAGKVERLTGES